jgi:SAM-dependent methyltransferase
MKHHEYKSYREYLEVQVETNKPRIPWTIEKAPLRAQDIENIKKLYSGRRVVCLGCRHDMEVDDFIRNGFDAVGIDVLPTERQLVGDFNKLEKYFSDCSFDLAYSCHALEHTNDPIHFLQMIRRICTEGLYLVIPIRDCPDIEEPIFLDAMHTRNIEDLERELEPGLGKLTVLGYWIRDGWPSPSGPEMAFAIRWQ